MKRKIKLWLEKNFLIFLTHEDKEDIFQSICSYDYVSFDIFDTLIKRDVVKDPEDVFQIVEERYNMIHPSSEISNFKSLRCKAYKNAKRKSSYEEVTLNEIYDCMTYYSFKQRQELMELEMEVEFELCQVNKKMFWVYDKCVKENKKIFISSDMYLSLDFLKEILDKAGYGSYDKLYVSCEEHFTKKSGKLFQKLLQDNQISKKDVIHIGDSFFHDYVGAKKIGVKTLLIK